MRSDFYKNNKDDKIWWTCDLDLVGEFLFSFDKKKIYNLFADYPHNMTPKEIEIFDKENPYWADFFKNRRIELISSNKTDVSETKIAKKEWVKKE